jgi:hypothetical protein
MSGTVHFTPPNNAPKSTVEPQRVKLNLSRLTVSQLKEHLRARGLRVGGRKDELVVRLAQSFSRRAPSTPRVVLQVSGAVQ